MFFRSKLSSHRVATQTSKLKITTCFYSLVACIFINLTCGVGTAYTTPYADNPEEAIITTTTTTTTTIAPSPTPLPTSTTTSTTTVATISTTTTSTTSTIPCSYQIDVNYTATDRTNVFSGSLPYSCLANIVQACGNDWLTHVYRSTAYGNSIRCNGLTTAQCNDLTARDSNDDCVAGYLLGYGIQPYTRRATFAQFFGWQDFNAARGIAYIDENCQPRNTGRICGTGSALYGAVYLGTPISLIWDAKSTSSREEGSFVKFPVSPQDEGKWFLWRASARFPLLVWDPEHKGEIISSSQLFGNFTFGKKWKHGYEALASLETNTDGKLSEDELAPLALWFDENKNGVSEKGEVKTLADVGVINVYYKSNEFDALTGEYFAELGFERLVDGKVEKGASIDWRTKTFTAKPDLNANNFPADNISGAWFYRATKSDQDIAVRSSGLLVFNKHLNLLDGHSYLQIPLKDNRDNVKYAVQYFRLEGEDNIKKDNTITFRIEDPDNKVSTVSTAKLDRANNTLTGYSTVTNERTSEKFSYHWTASRNPTE